MSSRSMRSRLRAARRVRIALGAVLSAALAFAPLAAAPAAAVGEGFTVSGTVYVGSEDRLAAEGEVRIAVTASTGTTTYGSTTTAADGTFSISGLTAPHVRIVFAHLGPEDFEVAVHPAGPCVQLFCPTVALDRDLTVDMVVPAGRGPFGTVVNASKTPLKGIRLTLVSSTRSVDIQTVTTNSAGEYWFQRVTDDVYYIRADDPSGAFAPQLYDGVFENAAATRIDLRDGARPPAIAITMQPAGRIDTEVRIPGLDGQSATYSLTLKRLQTNGLWQDIETVMVDPANPRSVFRGLRSGTYTFSGFVSTTGLGLVNAPVVDVAPGQAVSATVRFKPAGKSPNRDFSGDGIADVLAVATNGNLLMYRGTAWGSLVAAKVIGAGWSSFDHVFAVGDFSGDGLPDLLARQRTTGVLFLYRGDGAGGWRGSAKVGTGWQSLTALISPGDFNSDGTNDVLARDPAGKLWLYPGTGAGAFGARSYVGAGWETLNSIIGAGDVDGDNSNDVLGVWRGNQGLSTWVAGKLVPTYCLLGGRVNDLILYSGTGAGGVTRTGNVGGAGWCSLNKTISGGDRVVIGRDSAGNLFRYDFTDPFAMTRTKIGVGWGTLRLVS